MTIHESYLRKQAVAVEHKWGKGSAKDLLAAADEIARLSARVELLEKVLTTPGADAILPGSGDNTFADELDTLAAGMNAARDDAIPGQSAVLWRGVLKEKAKAIRHAITGD